VYPRAVARCDRPKHYDSKGAARSLAGPNLEPVERPPALSDIGIDKRQRRASADRQ
jgi:hypothetical protein